MAFDPASAIPIGQADENGAYPLTGDFDPSTAVPITQDDLFPEPKPIVRTDGPSAWEYLKDAPRATASLGIDVAKEGAAQLSDLLQVPAAMAGLDHMPWRSGLVTKTMPAIRDWAYTSSMTIRIPEITIGSGGRIIPTEMEYDITPIDAAVGALLVAQGAQGLKYGMDANKYNKALVERIRSDVTRVSIAENIEAFETIMSKAGIKLPAGMSLEDRVNIVISQAEQSPTLKTAVQNLAAGRIKPVEPFKGTTIDAAAEAPPEVIQPGTPRIESTMAQELWSNVAAEQGNIRALRVPQVGEVVGFPVKDGITKNGIIREIQGARAIVDLDGRKVVVPTAQLIAPVKQPWEMTREEFEATQASKQAGIGAETPSVAPETPEGGMATPSEEIAAPASNIDLGAEYRRLKAELAASQAPKEGGGITVYRGDTSKIDLKDYDVEKGIKDGKELGGAFAEGPGIYFTTKESNAKGYGPNISTINIPETANIVTDESPLMSRSAITKMLKDVDSETLDIAYSNWAENKTEAKKLLIDALMNAENPKEQLINIWADVFYHQQPNEFMALMKKHGIDGIKVAKEGQDHYVIYNRDLLRPKLSPKEGAQPMAGGLTRGREIPEQMKKWLEKGVTVSERGTPIRIVEPEAKIKDISGKVVDLPKGHEMTPWKLSNGKIWLHDGKDVIIELGQFQNLANKNIKLGGMFAPRNPEHYEAVRKALEEGKPVPERVLKDYPDLQPGKSETKTRGLSAGIEEKAIEDGLIRDLGDLPTYQTRNMKDVARRVKVFIDKDPELAKKIALMEAPEQDDLRAQELFTGLRMKAVAEHDIETLRELALSDKANAMATELGQRIKALDTFSPEDPVKVIREVAEARKETAQRRLKTKDVRKVHKEEVTRGKAEIKKAMPTKETWAEFVKSLEC